MATATRNKFGPYEITGTLGAGGMGEVYRARDPRLGREVAIKVLPAAFSSDAERLRRFEQEARAAAALNHPNILSVFDIGASEGAPYIVSELLEGETLRGRLRSGAMPVRKAVETALAIAQGLAAAHEKGIIHRDLKPENLFLTRDGRVKILDFGLAKLTQPEASHLESLAPTAELETGPGTVLGTLGYMSPEQVRGQAADARSDIFSLGAILYEMLSGKRAFHGATSADTISAILKEDPPELSETNRNISPALERIVRHCLEKIPEQRFRSASDIAFDLESLSATSGTTAAQRATEARDRRHARMAAFGMAIAVLIAIAFVAGRFLAVGGVSKAAPEIHQLTFRRGTVNAARFSPDGQSEVYSAAWEGQPEEVFTTSPQSPESRSLDLKDARLLAVSSTGQMLIKLHVRVAGPYPRPGTLATLPLTGGAPRELLDNVESADWSPDGSQLAVIEDINGQFSVQYPIGKTLFTAPYWLSHLRVSPSGEQVAFLNHPFGGDEGSVMVVDQSGKAREISKGWLTLQGLAWSGDGKEIWFTGTRVGGNRGLFAVSPTGGNERLLERIPGDLTLQDVSPHGEVLLTSNDDRAAISALAPGAEQERDLSWFDFSSPRALSSDGKLILFTEVGEGGGAHYSTYLRATDGSPAILLGEGGGCDLSPDGKWALTYDVGDQSRFFLLPTGAGTRQTLKTGNLRAGCARFLPDGKSIIFPGGLPGGARRIYRMGLEPGATPKPVTPEGVFGGGGYATPDGKMVAATDADGNWAFYPLEGGGAPQSMRGIEPGELMAGISSDGREIYTVNVNRIPAPVYRADWRSGRRSLWKELAPADRAGVTSIGRVRISGDGKSYLYVFERDLTELYLVRGLR